MKSHGFPTQNGDFSHGLPGGVVTPWIRFPMDPQWMTWRSPVGSSNEAPTDQGVGASPEGLERQGGDLNGHGRRGVAKTIGKL